MYLKKTWQAKMTEKKGIPKILTLEKKFPCFNTLVKMGAKEGDSCVLVNPKEVEEIMTNVPQGKLVTLKEISLKLAKKHNVKACCTLTAGIFTMIAANASEELKSQGKENNNPYWRTLKIDGYLNPKYPGGQEAQKKLLEIEGFTIVKKGKNYKVSDFEKYLIKI
jgi:alkylated DNA nucleotide flippase Atl1